MERAAAGDPAARARIRAWEQRLGPLAERGPRRDAAAAGARRVVAGVAAVGPPPATTTASDRALRAQLRRWRIAAGGAGLLAAGLALFVVVGPSLTPSGGRYLAVVQGGGTLPALIVRVDLEPAPRR